MRKIAIFLILVTLASAWHEAIAHSYKQGDISIGHIWARATPAGATTAAIYVPLLNTGMEEDKLVGATTDLADKIEIHGETKENGITKMTMLAAIDLEPNQPVTLEPGGMHLMVVGLKQPLKEGDMFPLTLKFEKAGEIKVEAKIAAIGATPEHQH